MKSLYLIQLLNEASKIEDAATRKKAITSLINAGCLLSIDINDIEHQKEKLLIGESIPLQGQCTDLTKLVELLTEDIATYDLADILDEISQENVRYKLTDKNYTGHLNGYDPIYHLQLLINALRGK